MRYFYDMNSLTEENYLKALFSLAGPGGEVNVNELSRKLGIKMPTVTSMMKKLSAKKLVHYESYRPLRLTEKGKREAGLIIRKHRLTEMFLVQVMGFGWEQVHEIAEQVEHIQSAPFFEQMDVMLGFPKIDPHGSPIPDRNGKMEWREYTRLSEARAGDVLNMTAVLDSSSSFLQYLNNNGLKLGLKIRVKSVEDFDRSMVVSYTGHKDKTLSQAVCERLLGERLGQ
jgi:DtxR family transcriptional regulator, Mn-dependent transcriptional regulator